MMEQYDAYVCNVAKAFIVSCFLKLAIAPITRHSSEVLTLIKRLTYPGLVVLTGFGSAFP